MNLCCHCVFSSQVERKWQLESVVFKSSLFWDSFLFGFVPNMSNGLIWNDRKWSLQKSEKRWRAWTNDTAISQDFRSGKWLTGSKGSIAETEILAEGMIFEWWLGAPLNHKDLKSLVVSEKAGTSFLKEENSQFFRVPTWFGVWLQNRIVMHKIDLHYLGNSVSFSCPRVRLLRRKLPRIFSH